MGFGLGDLLGAGASILGAIGKGKDKPASQQSGYSAAPEVVRKDLEGTYWPYAMSVFNDLVNQPRARVAAPRPGDLFANPEAYAMQAAADMRAGLIPQQELIYQNGQLQPLAYPSPVPGQTFAPPGGQATAQPPAMQGTPVANKSSGTYLSPAQSLGLMSQGISTPSLAAYLAQLGVR